MELTISFKLIFPLLVEHGSRPTLLIQTFNYQNSYLSRACTRSPIIVFSPKERHASKR